MTETGLVETSEETTPAPKVMYQEMEQDEAVARGHIRVTEVIAYDATKEPRRYIPEEGSSVGRIMKDKDENILYVEKSRGPYFYQDTEDFLVFKENNPDARLETFGIQMLKSIAIRYLDSPENMEQFTKKEVA